MSKVEQKEEKIRYALNNDLDHTHVLFMTSNL